MTLFASVIPSPVGDLLALVREDGALTALHFMDAGDDARVRAGAAIFDDARCAEVRTQLAEYFEGRRRTFSLPLAPQGTPFQLRVWRALENIPFGATMGYAELARSIANPNASRAVGRANGANPIPIILPCHRVIGANGDLTGYGGGIARKQILLRHERALPAGLELESARFA
jgi:methylated-DNA-[protein]-cysteine S-methyltransferase